MFYLILIAVLVAALPAAAIVSVVRFHRGKKAAETAWQSTKVQKLPDPGQTDSLTILPLVDWAGDGPDFRLESGVSYLIRTDETDILFDCGLNQGQESPSPLVHNMNRLGVGLDSFDTLVISHNHMDHVGGFENQKNKTFSLDKEKTPLTGKRVFVPVPMTYPGLDCRVATEPRNIAKGVSLTGTIDSHLHLMGRVSEQSLAVNVTGKGIVLIVGCGHQTLPRLLQRVGDLFDIPLYGIVGGLHLPQGRMDGSIKILGLPAQKYLGTGKLAWRPITAAEVRDNLQLLDKLNPRLVALSPHDSSQGVLEMFKAHFKEAYRTLKVGLALEV